MMKAIFLHFLPGSYVMKQSHASSMNEFHVEVETNKKMIKCFAAYGAGPEAGNMASLPTITPVPQWTISEPPCPSKKG